LRTIPFGELDIRTLSVEYRYAQNNTGKQEYVEFMSQQGYYVHKDIIVTDIPYVHDFIFVKRETIIRH